MRATVFVVVDSPADDDLETVVVGVFESLEEARAAVGKHTRSDAAVDSAGYWGWTLPVEPIVAGHHVEIFEAPVGELGLFRSTEALTVEAETHEHRRLGINVGSEDA